MATTAVWSYALLERSAGWQPWLRPARAGGRLLAAGPARRRRPAGAPTARPWPRRASRSLWPAPRCTRCKRPRQRHSGSLPSAGPAVSAGGGGRFGPGGGTGGGSAARRNPSSVQAGNGAPIFNGAAGANGAPSGTQGGPTGTPVGAPAGGTGSTAFAAPGASGAGNAGGLLDASTPSAALVTLLEQDADRYTWVAATVGAQSAAGYQLATDDPVMSLGGFNGSDPYPTLAEFQALVTAGKVHYFIAGGVGGSGDGGGGNAAGAAANDGTGGPSTGLRASGGSTSMSAISAWVEAHFTSQTVGGITVYDLTSRSS